MPESSFKDWNICHGERIRPLPEKIFTGKLLINGVRQNAKSGKMFETRSPAHGIPVGNYAEAGTEDTDLAMAAARHAFDEGPWPKMSGKDRSAILKRVAVLILERIEEIAFYESLESGKPIVQARDEIQIAADLWEYAAALARSDQGGSHNNLGENVLGLTIREPVGVVAMIMPWNFPLLIACQKLPFALAAGSCCVLKPSELTSASTVMLGDILLAADLPPGVVNILLGKGDPVGQAMISHPQTDMTSFTGSTQVGKAVLRASAERINRTSLELGGKNPQVIFPDCDWQAMTDAVVFGMCFNAGECCNSGSRALVHRDIAERFIEDVVSLACKVPLGDPLHPSVKMGAIISKQHYAKITGYVKEATEKGARVCLGGDSIRITGADGLFYPPTVLADLSADMPAVREEIFGPVLSVIPFADTEEAIRLANDSPYGLSAGVWSRDIETCMRFARQVKAGTVWVNGWMDGFAELPFGGFKTSGLGRELGHAGLHEFQETKTIQLHGPERGRWL